MHIRRELVEAVEERDEAAEVSWVLSASVQTVFTVTGHETRG